MIKKMGYVWHLRRMMADCGMFQTTELVPLLAERGIHLSREQVFRLVTQPPQRLSMDTLAALCDILRCTPNDLIEVEVVNEQLRRTAEVGAAPVPQPGARSFAAQTNERQAGAGSSCAGACRCPARQGRRRS
ncbi:helix-turn-helix transcriptional regulator [Micromonosporaceae bacterium B7E4]